MSKQSVNLSGSMKGMGCAVMFLLPFAVVGVFMVFRVASQIWEWQAAKSWVERPCWIERAELKTQHGDSATYRADADYRYEVGDKEFRSSRVSFGSGFDNIGGFHWRAHRELWQHQLDKTPFRCFVSPRDPSESVLYRDLRGEMLLFHLAFVLAFGGFGGGGLIALVFVWRKVRRMNIARSLRPNEPWTWDESTADGRFKPLPQWVGTVALAFLWNAISWPAAMMFCWNGIPQGLSIEWLVLMFPLFGLVLIGKSVRAAATRLRVGVPILQIKPWPFRVGDELTGTIEFLKERPDGDELEIELQVIRSGSDDDSDKMLFKETTRIPNEESDRPFTFQPPDNLPRTELLNENSDETTASWKIQIKAVTNERDSGYKATYEIPVFAKQPRDEE